MMKIFEQLTAEHDRVRELLARLDKTSGDSEERRELFLTLRRELVAHAKAEEQTFYGPLMERSDGQEPARHGAVEHEELDGYLEDLKTRDFSDSSWLLTFRKLKECAEHHMAEEEQEIFRLARRVLPEQELVVMGRTFPEVRGNAATAA